MESALTNLQAYLIDPLRPYLAPITSNLPTPVNTFLLDLLGAPCHSALLLDVDIASHPECTTLLLSKVMGIAIITTASIVKVPQILKIITSESARGLSLSSLSLETAAFAITLAYNVRKEFPFSTYGETVFILLQNIVLGYLIVRFSQNYQFASAFPVATFAVIVSLFSADIVPDSLLATLQAFAGFLSSASKVPQILAVHQQGGTGQLSAFAVFNYLVGSAMRILTSLREVDDKLILGGFVAGFTLNAVLALQMAYYWNSGSTAKHGQEVKVVKDTVEGAASGAATGARKGASGARKRA